MAFLAGSSISGQTSQSASGGNADVRAATGNKNINVGGNPNVQAALGSPVVVIAIAVVLAVWLWRRK